MSHPTPHSGLPHVTVRGLSVARAGTTLFTGLDLTATAGRCVAILGENGRGKSSLLATITGDLAPSAGTVDVHGHLAIAHQHLPAEPGMTIGDLTKDAIGPSLTALSTLEQATMALADGAPGAESAFADALGVAESLDAWSAKRRIGIALQALSALTEPGHLLEEMSVGQRYRVRLACILGGDYDVVLLDEPTNHLDHEALEFLTDSIKRHKGVVIVVSHDRALVRDVADTIVDLDPTPDGSPRIHGDGFDQYHHSRQAMLGRWRQDHRDQQRLRERLTGDLEEAQSRVDTAWRPPKGTGKHTRASRAPGVVQAVKRAQAAVDAAPVPMPHPPLELDFPDLKARPGATLIRCSDLTLVNRLTLPHPLEITSGDRYVITGANGAGKTTLLDLLAGLYPPGTGTVSHHARIGYLTQESIQAPDSPALGEVGKAGEAAIRFGLLSPEAARKKYTEMSMGQRRRVDLATILATDPQLLLFDEPTNHLSMHLVDQLTEALHDTPAAVVLVTHDRQLLRDTEHWNRIHLG